MFDRVRNVSPFFLRRRRNGSRRTRARQSAALDEFPRSKRAVHSSAAAARLERKYRNDARIAAFNCG